MHSGIAESTVSFDVDDGGNIRILKRSLSKYAAHIYAHNLLQHQKPGSLVQVRGEWLCRGRILWDNGVLECWSIGFGGIRSVFT